MSILAPITLLTWLLWLTVMVLGIIALVDAAMTPASAFLAAQKATKQLWVTLLAVAVAVTAIASFFTILAVAAAVVTILYLVDVRPALRRVRDDSA